MKHLDNATIQAFLDGELSDADLRHATQHISFCSKCAAALMQAEAEQLDIDFAFAVERALPVPTQRIWARIENEIDSLAWQPQKIKIEEKTLWQRCAEFLTIGQLSFAGSLAAVVLVSLFALSAFQHQIIPNTKDSAVSILKPERESRESSLAAVSDVPSFKNNNAEIEDKTAVEWKNTAPRFIKASYQAPVKVSKLKTDIQRAKPFELPVAEEKDYLNTIAQLSKAVNTSDGLAMRPSFRVEYERNLATINQAIKIMQKQARLNPKDENAKRILFASYQNKIDLLNTINEKTQLIASLR
jgi:hypothetical protein